MLITHKNEKVTLAISILILALTTSLLWFKISIHSDSLFLDSLAKDLFEQNGKWSDWRFSPAPAYFPDMLLYFLAYTILPNAYSRIFFVSVAQIIILTFAVTWTSKQIYHKNKWRCFVYASFAHRIYNNCVIWLWDDALFLYD